MTDMISKALEELNDTLREVGADFTVGAHVDLPFQIEVEGKTIETHITIEVTEDGYETVNFDQQVDRIVQEMKDAAKQESNSKQ